MRKISSIFVALCFAASAFAQAEMTPQSMLPKRQSVFRTPTTNALDQRVMERLNAEKEDATVAMSPAMAQAEGDTIHINAYVRHILHPQDNRWGIQSADGQYEFDLAWISETFTGTFTKEDMVVAKRGYANYVKIWAEDNSKCNIYEFEEITLEVKYVNLTGAIKQLNVDASIKGFDSKNNVVKYFHIHADREDLFPKDTVTLNVPQADSYEILLEDSAFVMQGKTEDGVKVSVSLLTTTFPGKDFYFAYFNRPQTFVEFYENGDTIRYIAIKDDQGLAAEADTINTKQVGRTFDLNGKFLAADTVLYQVKMHYELPVPTDTVVIDINNMLIDDSNAADGGGYYIDGYNDEYAVELLTLKASGTVESPNMNASIKDLAHANAKSLIELWGKVEFTTVKDTTFVSAEVIANDHKFYQISMCSRVDAIRDTIVVNMPGHCIVVTDQQEGWQFYAETDSIVASTAFYASSIFEEGDYNTRNFDIITDAGATFLYVKKAGGEMIQERLAYIECSVRPNATKDTVQFTTWMTTYIGKLYEVHMTYYIPQAIDTVDVTISNVQFSDGRETNGSWSIWGMSQQEEDKQYFLMISPKGDTLEGRWIMDGLFRRFDFDCNFQAFYIITHEGEKTIQTQESLVDGWLESHIARDTNFIEAQFLATDDIIYRFHITLDLRYRLKYDCDDKNQDLEWTYTEEDKCYVSDVAHEAYNMLYWVGNSYHKGDKEALLTQIVFFSEEKDPQITIPEGIYPINWSLESGTVLASYGVGTAGANPSLAGFFEDNMITSDGKIKSFRTPLYFFFTGQVEVKKLDGGKKLSIEVNALNSYDVPIHIYYEGVPVTESVTAIEHVENNTTTPTTKYIKDGVLYIRRGERVYNVLGGVVCQ